MCGLHFILHILYVTWWRWSRKNILFYCCTLSMQTAGYSNNLILNNPYCIKWAYLQYAHFHSQSILCKIMKRALKVHLKWCCQQYFCCCFCSIHFLYVFHRFLFSLSCLLRMRKLLLVVDSECCRFLLSNCQLSFKRAKNTSIHSFIQNQARVCKFKPKFFDAGLM